MAVPNSLGDREYQKFTTDGSGNTAVRLLGVSATIGSGSGLASSKGDREYQKFIVDGSGNTAILVSG